MTRRRLGHFLLLLAFAASCSSQRTTAPQASPSSCEAFTGIREVGPSHTFGVIDVDLCGTTVRVGELRRGAVSAVARGGTRDAITNDTPNGAHVRLLDNGRVLRVPGFSEASSYSYMPTVNAGGDLAFVGYQPRVGFTLQVLRAGAVGASSRFTSRIELRDPQWLKGGSLLALRVTNATARKAQVIWVDALGKEQSSREVVAQRLTRITDEVLALSFVDPVGAARTTLIRPSGVPIAVLVDARVLFADARGFYATDKSGLISRYDLSGRLQRSFAAPVAPVLLQLVKGRMTFARK